MSKYREIETQFKEEALLHQALVAVGIPFEHSAEGASLYDYHGQRRPEQAEYIIRRQHVDHWANDLGWRRTESGYSVIISEYDSRGNGQQLANRVAQEYARAFIHREAQRRGYHVLENRQADGHIQVQLRRG